MTSLQAPKGVPEYFPGRSAAFLAVRDSLSAPARKAGYGYVELPMFEDTALYVRGVGESTDVVSKEMYTFEDRGGRSLSLRPEGTAGVMRMVIEHSLDRGQLPVKLWYAGAFFRAERPQHGRYRQLQQVGLEAIGSDDPALDAEVIALADEGFRSLGLKQFTLQLTSLGCAQCRPAYRELLQEFLSTLDLDESTRERAAVNPLRVLDDKREEVQTQLAGVPYMVNHLCADCQTHYDDVRTSLRLLNVEWSEAPSLVRGLDYYSRTAFEFTHHLLGAQSGIGGGGRYDGLMSSLGGQDLSGIGWGLGTDRTLLACEAEGLTPGAGSLVDVFAIPIGDEAKSVLVALSGELRAAGFRVDLAYGNRGLKGAMKAADRSGAPYVLIVGDQEVADGTVVVKDMSAGTQESVSWESVQSLLATRLKENEGNHS
jgi:histidyl-tRNA synthetase